MASLPIGKTAKKMAKIVIIRCVFGWEVSRARSGSAGASAADFQAECDCGFSGPEHVYERLKPEGGIHCSILGNSAKLMTHDFRSKQDMELGVDRERAFVIVEFAGDNLYFQTISRTRQTIDSGTVARQ